MIFSGVECKDEIYSSSQLLLASIKTENLCNNKNNNNNKNSETEKVLEKVIPKQQKTDKSSGNIDKFLVDVNSPPLSATSKIFAPRTEEMNKGFLTFSDDEPGLTSE